MIDTLKKRLREDEYPFFKDEALYQIIDDCKGDIDTATYNALIIKAEGDGIKLSDLSLESSRRYWLSLAALYRKSRTGSVKRGDFK